MYVPTPGEPNVPVGIQAVRWVVPPTGGCEIPENEKVRIAFTVEQDQGQVPPEVTLGYRLLDEGCDLDVDTENLLPADEVLLVSQVELELECSMPVPVEDPCFVPPGCRRDVEGQIVDRVSSRGWLRRSLGQVS